MKIKDGYKLIPFADGYAATCVSGESNTVISLNETSAMLWRALEGGADADTLCKVLTDNFEVDGQRAMADVQNFVSALRSANLLTD